MLYRIRQFAQALYARVTPEELAWVRTILPPAGLVLFLRQSPAVQKHALSVAKALTNYSSQLSADDCHVLLCAALLHDCGKALYPLKLWDRIFPVLADRLPQSWRTWLVRGPKFCRRPLRVADQHARWGKILARQAGLPPQVCQLIGHHHAPHDSLGHLLFVEDNRH